MKLLSDFESNQIYYGYQDIQNQIYVNSCLQIKIGNFSNSIKAQDN